EGAASIACLLSDREELLLATNNGSLYSCIDESRSIFVYASERYILKTFLEKSLMKNYLNESQIEHIKPGEGSIVNLTTLKADRFYLTEKKNTPRKRGARGARTKKVVTDILSESELSRAGKPVPNLNARSLKDIAKAFPQDDYPYKGLIRCSKCVLPETIPGIHFNEKGICNFCRAYKKREHYGPEALEETISKYRSKTGKPDCIVGMSGGRDSIYSLHYVKNVLKMNPIAYTYDWGMVTDLARRNISRICGKLGVENILVSADIPKKRANIRKNVSAWLKKPDLGIIPLFMAGDKQYFYYATEVKKQNDLELVILGENMFEKSEFKAGFSGVTTGDLDEDRIYTLSHGSKFQMVSYYMKSFLNNPGYLNSSLLDTAFAFACYYITKRDYINLFRYVPWNEEEVNATIIGEYNWELSPDTTTTWRIGDGTASFYNYIYFTVAGFTENDTFRSNQIREGIITRAKGMKFIKDQNRPRFMSIKWYCDTIGVDFEAALKIINEIPKLYVPK
ncbi:MAG: hypothetical protein V3T30_06175, partial [Thermodesulfobacteriota bacterium]